MAWVQTFLSIRFVFIGFFSLTALGLMVFQSISIFQAFVEFYEVLHRK
ncbi:hypothetical protein [Halobacillus litoralis]|nr:hypothetical protein [Halobacillus litoralis]